MKNTTIIKKLNLFSLLISCSFLLSVTNSHAEKIQAEDYSWAHDTTTGNTGNTYRSEDVDIEVTHDEGGGYNVGWIAKSEWLAFEGLTIPVTGEYIINVRVASPSGGSMSVDLNGGEIALGSLTIPNTGSWSSWQTISTTVQLEAGTFNLGVFAETAGWNFNWIEFVHVPEEVADGEVVWAVNAGGNAYTSSDGVNYSADEGFSNGNAASTGAEIKATPDPTIYQSERWGQNISYAKTLDNGSYTVNLKFAEIHWSEAGKRQFSVSAEGLTRLASVDIFNEKGHKANSAYDLTIPEVVVNDGQLNLDFNGIVDAAKISAFVVREQDAADDDWQLVWHDEFDTDGAIDDTKWSHEEWAPGRVNNEWQRYTNRTENSRVENGKLIIEARKDLDQVTDGTEYSSARIHTRGKSDFLYGRIEVNAKLPNGVGTWPAIWMMPSNFYKYATTCTEATGWVDGCDAWPNSGEIDMMEHVGYDTGKVHATVHNLAGYWVNGQQRQATVYQPSVDDEFHTYTIEWTPERIDMFIDETLYYSYINQNSGFEQWPYDHEFHLILNLVVGGDWGGIAGVEPNIWPQRMEVDYVRMYQK